VRGQCTGRKTGERGSQQQSTKRVPDRGILLAALTQRRHAITYPADDPREGFD
jgi:hypothetical protein